MYLIREAEVTFVAGDFAYKIKQKGKKEEIYTIKASSICGRTVDRRKKPIKGRKNGI